MYFQEPLYYPFDSKDLKQKAVAAYFLSILPLLNFFGMIVFYGYGAKIIRHVMEGEKELPELDPLIDFFDGLPVFFALVVHTLPFVLIVLVLRSSLPPDSPVFLLLLIGFVVSILTLIVGLIRYAMTHNRWIFLQAGEHLMILLRNPGEAVMFVVNAVALWVIGAAVTAFTMILANILLIGRMSIGVLVLLIPAVFIVILMNFSMYCLYAHFGMRLGFRPQEKAKTGY